MPEITKMDMLEYIRVKRDALNEETVKASPQEEGQYLPELQMWNAIEAQIREMTAVEYCEKHTRMCEFCMRGNAARGVDVCTGCPLDDAVPACGDLVRGDPRRAVEIVKRWKEERGDV